MIPARRRCKSPANGRPVCWSPRVANSANRACLSDEITTIPSLIGDPHRDERVCTLPPLHLPGASASNKAVSVKSRFACIA
jgi:hypothetical protein